MKPFSLLIKPASADCNLRCEYCFYLDRSRLYPAQRRHRMSDEVLERMISTYMATDQPQYVFGWQGGEPTLMGADFFRKATDLQKKYARPGAIVANGLQTNGTLIDDDFARHFAEYNFLVGVSLDGPPELHDRFRRTGAGKPSHRRVMEGIAKLARHGIEFNILVLVSAANVEHAAEVYRYLRDHGFAYHQYIPCVEFDGDGALRPFAITAEQWGGFICEIFDEWAAGDAGRISVRLFDALVTYMVTGERVMCRLARNCCQYFVVEHNGDIYPCDFFVSGDLHVGNIMRDSWAALQAKPLYKRFGKRKLDLPKICRECEYLEFCAGDCLKHRVRTEGADRKLSWLCAGWKRFFAHALPRLRDMAEDIKRERGSSVRA